MIYFIVNEKSKSGKGSQVWSRIVSYMESASIPYHYRITAYPGHAKEIAADISRMDEKEKYVIIVGGDGTVNEVINGITDFERIVLGVIPNGSGNDFVRGIKSERNPEKFLDNLKKSGDFKRIDVGEVCWKAVDASGETQWMTRRFGISAGFGMDALVCKLAMTSRIKGVLNKLHLGKLTYLLLTIKSLFTMETANGMLTLDETGYKRDNVIFAAMMNLRAEGGGVPMAPSADCSDGKLSMCCAFSISKWKTFLYLPFLVMAKHGRLNGLQLADAGQIQWKLDKPMTLHTDGEYCGEVEEVSFRCLNRILKIIT